MKAYLINIHLLVPRSRSTAKVKVKYKGYISQKMAVSGAFVFHKHILFSLVQFSLTSLILGPTKDLCMDKKREQNPVKFISLKGA